MKPSPSIREITILDTVSIQRAIQVLNDGHKRIVLVVNEAGVLTGVLADSDVRRALLSKKSLDSPVASVMKKNPIVVKAGTPDKDVLNVMIESHCFEIPVIDQNGFAVDLKTIQDLLATRLEAPVTALIMAGGMGRRLLPLTEKIPKPLIEVGGRPILFTLLDSLLALGVRRIFISLNYKGDMIKAAVESDDNYRGSVEYIEEQNPLGTAGALSLLPDDVASPIILANADLLTKVDLASMVRFHKSENNIVTVGLREESFQVPFGVAKTDGHRLLGIDEKPVQKFYVSAGIYVLNPSVRAYIPAQTALDMPDLINKICSNDEKVGSFPIFEYWKDVGEHDALEEAQADFSNLKKER